jgi:hypothetical protein
MICLECGRQSAAATRTDVIVINPQANGDDAIIHQGCYDKYCHDRDRPAYKNDPRYLAEHPEVKPW